MNQKQALRHLKKFETFQGSLREYCDVKRPKLRYGALRAAFMRLQHKINNGELEPLKPPMKDVTPKNKQSPKKPTTKAKAKKANNKNNVTDITESVTKSSKKTKSGKKNKVEIIEYQLPGIQTINVEVKENEETGELIPVSLPTGLDLNKEQIQFCDLYVNGRVSATEAYFVTYNCKSLMVAAVCASKLLKIAKIAAYVHILRSVKKAKGERRLDEIAEEREMFNKVTVFDYGTILNGELQLKNEDEIDPDKARALKSVTNKRKIRREKGSKNEAQWETLEIENKIELFDKPALMRDEEKAITSPSTRNTIYNDPEITEIWIRFQDQTRSDALTAIDFAFELSSRGLEVPQAIQLMAKAEMTMEGDPPTGDDEEWGFDEMNTEWEEFKEHHEKEIEMFLPERRKQVQQIYMEEGFDESDKPKDVVVDNDNITNPDKE
jgi:hypothetical protein